MIIRKVKVTEYEYQAPINYVAGATEPDIQFQLTDYEIPSGATGRVYVGRSDGTFEYTVATISGNTVTVAPTSSMFSVKGAGAIQVTLYVGNEVVKNFAVPVYVHADLADDSAEAGSDVTGVFRAAEEEALADFQEQAEQIVEEVSESIPADYTALTEEVDELNERIDNIEPGLSDEAKQALLVCFDHVAWSDASGQNYYNALMTALYPAQYPKITALFNPGTNTIYTVDSLDSLKQFLTVKYYENADSAGTIISTQQYSLTGVLVGGTNIITVNYRNLRTAFSIYNVVDFFNVDNWAYPSGDLLLKVGVTQQYHLDSNIVPQYVAGAIMRRSWCLSHGVIPFVNENGEEIPGVYPVPLPKGATSVTATISPNTHFFSIRPFEYDDVNGYNSINSETGWKQGTATYSGLDPSKQYFAIFNTKYDAAGTSFPTEPTGMEISFGFD